MRRSRSREAQVTKSEFTADELAQFDGQEGKPAYVGYGDKVYDVSGSRMWKNGSHARKHQAGADLTEILKTAPHSDELLFKMPVVGKLVRNAAKHKQPSFLKIFYFFAYFNLVMVFLIVFVICLWRW
ncbi:MAG: hypothetical protein HQK96_09785 [Nitrospirae bacterium]|nr:hypothetical protein [Nitrospirota bacterium]